MRAAAAFLASGAAALAAADAAPPVGSFVQISEDEGLAHSDVRAITQDHEGFIWFGLRLGGLTRYDGYELQVHRHDPANPRTLGNQIIWSLLVDHDGTLWIGTEGGLDRYDRKTDAFVHYRHDPTRPDSLPNNVVTCLYEDAAGTLWAGTREGLARLDDRERGTFTTFRRPQVVEGSTATNTIRSILEDTRTGLFWLGTSDGLAAFDPRTGGFATYLHDPADPKSLTRNAVNKVVRDVDGSFWALTEFGANRFRPTPASVPAHAVQQPRLTFDRFFVTANAGNPGTHFVRDGLVDRKGRLWFGTRGGVHLFDRERGAFIAYRRRPGDSTSLSDDLVQAIFEDRTGLIWVGTYAGGVNRMRSDMKPFRAHRLVASDPRSLSENQISGVALDPSGRLWVSTVNGLNRRDADGWTRFLHDPGNPDSLPSNELATVAAAPNGDVWIGSNYGGIFRFDQHRFRSYPTSPSNVPASNGVHAFTGGQVNSILPDDRGGVWVGARAYGLDYFFENRFQHYSPQVAAEGVPEQPTTNPVFGFIEPDGDLWFATEASGLVRFSRATQRFIAFRPPILVPGATRSLHCMAEGADGVIWVGAADGLLKFDTKTERFVREYSTAHGLAHDAVMTIVRDRRGHLWIGTSNGLSDFDPVKETFRNYAKPDGLPASVFSQRAGLLGPEGRVYLGTRAGLVEFAPEDMRDNPVPPPVVLTELRWLGEPPANASGERSGTVVNIGDSVRVPPGQLGFSLRFSALDFMAPEKNQFRYRLEGWDTSWNTTSARGRSATYTALPPGSYTFRVQASNSDGVWNEHGASLSIIVEPHVWQTAWFRIIAGVLVAGIVFGVVRSRLGTIRRQNAELERQVSLRTAELQREIDVRQKAEAALRESHAQLEERVQERTAELARMNEDLQAEIVERQHVEEQLRHSQKMEAVGQLAGGIAHDFNNLLTVILGQSELLGEEGLMSSEERDSAVRDIKSAAQRASNLTRQLLVFSRHQAMNPTAIDLNAVVVGVGKLLRHVIGERIALETKMTAEPLNTVGDQGMLEQVVLNMAVNARDAMPRGGRLTIATTQITVDVAHGWRQPHAVPGDYVRLSVSDTGCGIPENVLQQIFEPFFTTKESGKGTGLGLAISQGIVQQHHGWIEVETRQGEGTTFHVYLPRHASSTPAELPPPRPVRLPGGGATILVVEDEEGVRGLVQAVLARNGYRVIEASSVAEALSRWRESQAEIDVLLTDIVMPGPIDGHELAAQLTKEKPDLRTVTMSGYDPSEVASQELGVPQLRKPFSTDELLAAVKSVCPS